MYNAKTCTKSTFSAGLEALIDLVRTAIIRNENVLIPCDTFEGTVGLAVKLKAVLEKDNSIKKNSVVVLHVQLT